MLRRQHFEADMQAALPRLRRYARALTNDAVRADDLVQDTLARGWEKRSLWRPGSDLRAWLFAIMHNTFVNDVRRHHVAESELEAARDIASRETLPDDALAMRDLQRALAALSAEQRSVLLLVGLEGLHYDEAAQILGVPIGTVMSRLSRARESLRNAMEADDARSKLRVIK